MNTITSAKILSALADYLCVDDDGTPFIRVGAKDHIDQLLSGPDVTVDAVASFLAQERDKHAVDNLIVFGKNGLLGAGPVGAVVTEGSKTYHGYGRSIQAAIEDARLRATYAQDRDAYARWDHQEARCSEDLREGRVNIHD